ncbi:peptidase S8/S53 domain-containing protein [Trichoderma pleuroticola]
MRPRYFDESFIMSLKRITKLDKFTLWLMLIRRCVNQQESLPSSARNVTYIPNTYIVELEHAPSTKAASLFSQRLGARMKYHVRKEFNNAKLSLHGFGPGHKISFGYDLVGDNYTRTNAPVPNDDSLVTCAVGGHGTHVAGIIGMTDAQNQSCGLVRVGLEAILGMYRVFGRSENSRDDVIMAAMQQAAEDGVDLITMSLGSLSYWEQGSPCVFLVESIVESGVAIIAALGNDCDLGPCAVSTSALAPEFLDVGSVENEVYPTAYKAHNNMGGSLEYISEFPFIAYKPLTIFQAGSGLDFPVTEVQARGCDTRVWTAAHKAITDGANTAVLIYHTKLCSFSAYSSELSALNVTTVICYTDDPDILVLLLEPDTPLSQLRWSYFSSIGPTGKMTLKLQLSSLGGNILSTYPRSAGGYAVLSGTSMAAPFAAGVCALVKSQRPDLSIAEIISLLQSTAAPMKALDMDIISSVTQQVNGSINAYAAVAADSQISPSQLSSDLAFVRFTNVHEAKYATANFSKSKLSLQPGKSAKIEIQLTAPYEPQPYSEPIYSGHIKIATDSSSYVVPYLEVPYSRSNTECIARNTTAWVRNDRPYVGSDSTSPGVVNICNYSILGSDGSVPDDINVPIVNLIIMQPSNLIRLEIVPVNTTFVPTYYDFDPSVKFDVAYVDLPLQEGFLGVPNYGIMAQWGIGNIPPGISIASLPGWSYSNTVTGFILLYPLLTHGNGTGFDLTSGALRPLLRVLRYGTNGTSADDYESWLGPIVNVKTS